MSWVTQAGSHLTAVVIGAATPSPTPSLRPGLKDSDVAPGFLGFIVTFAVVAATILLLLSMTRRIRRVNHADHADHVVEADIRLAPEPMGEVPPTTSELRRARKAARRPNGSGPGAGAGPDGASPSAGPDGPDDQPPAPTA